MNELYKVLNAAYELGLELDQVKEQVQKAIAELPEKELHLMQLVATAEFAEIIHEA